MGSIPLPALSIKPPQQTDPLEQYGRLMQLQHQAQAAPLQQQALQQQVQTGQVDLQQKQQQLKDQQAATSALSEWDGKDFNQLYPLITKHGGSAQAVFSLKKNVLDQQTQIATASKDNAQATEANIAATMKKNDLVTGALGSLVDPQQVPDDQLPAKLTSVVQSLTQQGALDPQHAQAAQKLIESGDPTAIRSGVDQFRKTLMAQSQITEEAAKHAGITKDVAQTGEANAITAQKQAETTYYQQHGGAPGVPIEAQQQADWLSKHPGQGPSDYVAWKAKQSPMALVMGNQLGGPQGGQQGNPALDLVANNYLQTGQMPPELSRSPGTITAVIRRAAEINTQNGGGSLAGNKANFEANKKSLDNLQKNFDQVSAFEGTAGKNLDLFIDKLSKIPDLGVKFANTPMRMIDSKMIGTDNYQAMKAAQQTAAAEAAKVLSSANASGVLSDTQKKEAEDMLSGNLSLSAAKAIVGTLKQDFSNRHQAYQQQISDIKQRIGGGAQQPATQSAGPAIGEKKTFPNGKVGVWDGKGYVAQ